MAVLAPVADRIFEAAMPGEILAALAAALAFQGQRPSRGVVIDGIGGGIERLNSWRAGTGLAMSRARREVAAADRAEGGRGWMRGCGHF